MSAMPLADEATIRAVCDYLHESFGENRVVPCIEHDTQTFRIQDIYGTPLHTLALSSDFLRVHAPEGIPSVLRRYQTAEALRRSGRTLVEVTDSGVKVPGRSSGGAEEL